MSQHDTEVEDLEALPALRELALNPNVGDVWTELDILGHRIWLARGAGGHPWLLASDSLARFREMIQQLEKS